MKMLPYVFHWVKMLAGIFLQATWDSSGGMVGALLVGFGREDVLLCLLADDEQCMIIV